MPRSQNSCYTGRSLSWKSACPAHAKPWVLFLAPHKVGVVTHPKQESSWGWRVPLTADGISSSNKYILNSISFPWFWLRTSYMHIICSYQIYPHSIPSKLYLIPPPHFPLTSWALCPSLSLIFKPTESSPLLPRAWVWDHLPERGWLLRSHTPEEN